MDWRFVLYCTSIDLTSFGGLGGIKRPPPETNDEPAGKKITNNVPSNVQTNISTPQPAPRANPAILKQHNVIENPPVRAGIREIDSNSGISSSCTVCGKHVHLVQRHLADGKLYHRSCFRCKQCTRTLQPGSYRVGDEPGTFVCTNHHQVKPSPPVTINITPTRPAEDPVIGNRGSPASINSVVHEQTNKSTTANSFGLNSSSLHNSTNRAALGFVSHTSGAHGGHEQPKKNTYNLPNTDSKVSPSAGNKPVQEHTNRTAVGFTSSNKDSPRVFSAFGSEQSNKVGPSSLNSRGGLGTTSSPVQEQVNKPTVAYQSSKGNADRISSQWNQPKDVKKERVQTGQQAKTPSFTSTITSPMDKLSSPLTKEQPKEREPSPKPRLSSTAKTKEARDKFFQSSPVVIEPTVNRPPVIQDSYSNGPGRSVTVTTTVISSDSSSEKDKARNFLLKNIPGPASPEPSSGATNPSAVYTPHRILEQNKNESKITTPKEESWKPIPKERESKVPKSAPSSSLPTNTPTPTINKESNKQNSGKSPQPAHPKVSSESTSQKSDALSAKSNNINSKVTKTENPEDWRGMLKPADKRQPGLTPEKDRHPFIDQGAVAQKKPTATTNVTVNLITPSPTEKESKPAPPATKTQESTASSTINPPKKKLLPVKLDLITDWPKVEQRWKDDNLANQDNALKWRPHLENNSSSVYISNSQITENASLDTVKPSNPKKPSLSSNEKARSPGKQRPEYIPEEAIQRELQRIEKELDYLELRGVDLEKQLRSCDGDETEDALMVDWFKLIHEKQLLLRFESELMHISRQQALEDQQISVDTELRNLMDKPERLKTPRDKEREQELLKKLVEIINDRSEIIECLDEDRIREREEDEMMEAMIQKHIGSPKEPSPDLKRRSRFSISGFWKSKEKNKS
ncbi:MICAL-like protein 2 isoform X2 [Bombina bombina]|uniref:MICAL-like protein 2 isoform X2 n=1 Tax=Bombina bombina TaxID=8345 RepID=UPI00235A7A7F|nr:MICAL-like protein 2 isoform X2 [Bombina bombina]